VKRDERNTKREEKECNGDMIIMNSLFLCIRLFLSQRLLIVRKIHFQVFNFYIHVYMYMSMYVAIFVLFIKFFIT